MMKLLEYVKSNQKEMDNPNVVDMLVFAQLSYLNFERCEIKDKFLKLNDYINDLDKICEKSVFPKKNKTLFEGLIESNRYKDLLLGEIVNISNENFKYFSITFKINNNYFIVFRGTDLSVDGWLEDINMAILEKIPSHDRAFDYINNIINKYEGNYYIIGHSKGGNIAQYVSTLLSKDIQDKIIGVYNFDGPGFKNDISNDEGFLNIKDKIYKYIPQDDVVGVLLNDPIDYQVIKSKSLLILQHDLYSWCIEDDDFIKLEKTSFITKMFDDTIYDWLNHMSDKEKIQLFALIEDIFKRSGITDLNQFREHKFLTTKKLLGAMVTVKRKDIKLVSKLIFALIKSFLGFYR